MYIFIARNYWKYKTIISLSPGIIQTILTYLTSSNDLVSKKERQMALLDLLKVYKPTNVEEEKLLLLCENAGFYKV